MTTVTVKIEGLDVLKKVIDNLDMEKVVAEAVKKVVEDSVVPQAKPCPFCGSPPRINEWGIVYCTNNHCSLKKVGFDGEEWDTRA